MGIRENGYPHSYTNSVNITGTGLGLFMAKEIAIGGDINAYSEGEGYGSHFVLTLPLVS